MPGQRLVLERFADYHQAGVPYLDKLTFEFGQDPTVAVLRLQKGEIDIAGDGIPPAQFNEIMSDAANKDLIAVGDQLHTGYVTLNAKMPPLDNVKVRQAINMAINKDRIVKLINNRGVPATQPLPPAMPGYDKDQKGYAFDPDKAKALLAEAGFANGFATEIYAMNVDPNPRIAQAIQQDLAAVGITAEVKSLGQGEVISAGGNTSAPMIWSGGMAWIADFPDPANFYYGILGCSSVRQWRLELGRILQRGARPARQPGGYHGGRGASGGARRCLEGDLQRPDEGCALGADLQREALHLSFGAARRRCRRCSPIRSTSR